MSHMPLMDELEMPAPLARMDVERDNARRTGLAPGQARSAIPVAGRQLDADIDAGRGRDRRSSASSFSALLV